jgi:hypothetical protein
VVGKPGSGVRANDIAREVAEPCHPVAPLVVDEVFAVDSYQAARAERSMELLEQEGVVREKLAVVRAVAHIAIAVGVAVQVRKRRRIDREIDRPIGPLVREVDRVAMVE